MRTLTWTFLWLPWPAVRVSFDRWWVRRLGTWRPCSSVLCDVDQLFCWSRNASPGKLFSTCCGRVDTPLEWNGDPACPRGLDTNSIFVKKSLICLEDKSVTPHQGNTVLFRSSQQLPRLHLGPLKGFLSWHVALQRLARELLPEMQGQRQVLPSDKTTFHKIKNVDIFSNYEKKTFRSGKKWKDIIQDAFIFVKIF